MELGEAGGVPSGAPMVTSLMTALDSVPDHRRAAGRRLALPAVLAFLSCGVLCGGRSLLAIVEWGRAHEAWYCAVFGFRRCTPCVNTLHRVLTGSDVSAFETSLRTWIEPQLEPPITLEPVATDGKAARGAKEQHHLAPTCSALSLVAAGRCWRNSRLANGSPG